MYLIVEIHRKVLQSLILNEYLRLLTWTILNSRGLLVTTPDPLGKKSRPTMFYKRDDFPDD